MAIPKPEPRDWQIANAKELQVTDREVLRLLRDTKKRVDEILKDLEGSTKNGVQRSQLMHTRAVLLAEQSKLFERLGDKVAALRADSASRAARLAAAADDALLRAVGKGAQSQFLYESALQISQRAIDVAMQRMKLSALPLSKRIYNTGVWMNGRLGRLINETLASGLDARAFAKRARDWFSPNTPGGVRYAAMRLARTEINNAFHSMSAEKYANTPWTTSVDWNLSKSHPKPDICNKLAEQSPFSKESVPARPHPQCMCYITANYQEEDDFVDSFLKGEYDDYLDAELAKNGWDEKAEAANPANPAPEKGVLPKTQAVSPERELAERLVTVEGDGREEIVQQIEIEARLTPNVASRLERVKKLTATEEKALKARFGKDAIGGFTSETREIGIAKEVFTPAYDRQFAREVKSGFLSRCPSGHVHDGLKSFVAHEYGHLVEEVIRFGGPSTLRLIVRLAAEQFGIKPPANYDKESINRWVAKNSAVIAKMVSKYGTETGGEMWAEIWAEYSANPDPRPHIKAIGDAIRMAAEATK